MDKKITTIFFLAALMAASFIIISLHPPSGGHILWAWTVDAPGYDSGPFDEVVYLALSGLASGINPVLMIASISLGLLLFAYNRNKVSQYSVYYLMGAFLIFFTFEYEYASPAGLDDSLLMFKVIMAMAMGSILLAFVSQSLIPGLARQASSSSTLKITYFMFLGALVSLLTLLYAGGASHPAVAYANGSAYRIFSLMVYNMFLMAPSALFMVMLSMKNLNWRLGSSMNRESVLFAGAVILVLSIITLEIVTLFIA